jgi:hypothetical protein
MRIRKFKTMGATLATSVDVDRVILLSQPSTTTTTTSPKALIIAALREAHQIHKLFVATGSPFEVDFLSPSLARSLPLSISSSSSIIDFDSFFLFFFDNTSLTLEVGRS